MCVDVEPGMRIAAAVAWKAAANISLLVRASTLLDEGCCSSCCYCCCYGRFSNTRRWWSTGSPPTESLVELSCVSCSCWVCVSWAEPAVPRNPDGKKNMKKQKFFFFPALLSAVAVGCVCVQHGCHRMDEGYALTSARVTRVLLHFS